MSRLKISALLVLAIPTLVFAKDQPARERGVLAEMQSVSCGTISKTGSSVAGVLITGSSHTQSSELLCQEYIVKADRVTYRIRPKEQKHAVLLHVGDEAEFRLKKNEMLLRVPESDNKEREYVVLSMIASPEFSSELNKTQHPPKPHGKKLDVNAPEPEQPQSATAPALVAPAPPARTPDPPLQASAQAPTPTPVSQTMLVIDSMPAGAEIFVDSASAGRTPATLNVVPGQHVVQVVATGYKDWVSTVTVPAGSQQRVSVNLSK